MQRWTEVLVPIEHHPASLLAKTFKEADLWKVVEYLDLLLTKAMRPREEARKLGIDPWSYDGDWEIQAVRNRVTWAITLKAALPRSYVQRTLDVQDMHTMGDASVRTA